MRLEIPDFHNTEIAFAIKSDAELKEMYWLFKMMNNETLVKFGVKLGLFAVKFKLPFAEYVMKKTLFKQFCGGRTLLESLPVIEKLATKNVGTILDYGAEAKQKEEDFNYTMAQMIRAIEFAAQHKKDIPVISTKITGIGRFSLLEKLDRKETLSLEEQEEYKHILKRIDAICYNAHQHGIGVFIDAEESWIQDTVDNIADLMMSRYNIDSPIVYNTFQMYRHSSLAFLKKSYEKAVAGKYILGAKVVRGAYMEKERERARELGYPSPIQPNKDATDADYNAAIKFSVEHIQKIAFCCATHNAESSLLYASLLKEKNIDGSHPHVLTSQLYGMSDHLTFNLAAAGIRSLKYLPYGPVSDVMPYLMRRAQENTSVTGDMSRELKLIADEIERRKL